MCSVIPTWYISSLVILMRLPILRFLMNVMCHPSMIDYDFFMQLIFSSAHKSNILLFETFCLSVPLCFNNLWVWRLAHQVFSILSCDNRKSRIYRLLIFSCGDKVFRFVFFRQEISFVTFSVKVSPLYWKQFREERFVCWEKFSWGFPAKESWKSEFASFFETDVILTFLDIGTYVFSLLDFREASGSDSHIWVRSFLFQFQCFLSFLCKKKFKIESFWIIIFFNLKYLIVEVTPRRIHFLPSSVGRPGWIILYLFSAVTLYGTFW